MMEKRKRTEVEKEDGGDDKENFVYFAHAEAAYSLLPGKIEG